MRQLRIVFIYHHQDSPLRAFASLLLLSFPPCLAQLESLRKWNLYLTALHFGAAIIQFAISSGTSPTFSSFPNSNRGKPTWAPALKFLYNNQVGLLSGIFLALAGIDHLFVGTVGRSMYEEYLAKKQNPFRWLEYSISASFMHIQVR